MYEPLTSNTPIAARIRLAGEVLTIFGLTSTAYDGRRPTVAVKLLADGGGFIPMQVHRDHVERLRAFG